MPEIPEVLEYLGKKFKIGDRIKCNVWPEINEPRRWVTGTIMEFSPTRVRYKGPSRIFFKAGEKQLKDPEVVIISDTDEGEGVIVFDNYRHIRMSIKTDERISDSPDALFEGFGWNTSGQHVIHEHEPEYDTNPTTVSQDEPPEDLPF